MTSFASCQPHGGSDASVHYHISKLLYRCIIKIITYLYVCIHIYIVKSIAIYKLRRPSWHSSGEIAVIVDAPTAGGGLAVRHGAVVAARPLTMSMKTTVKEPAVQVLD